MGRAIYYLPASYTAVIHSLIACLGLLFPLYVGVTSHSAELLVTHCGPDHYEFWPSISTTIGDVQPERQLWRAALLISLPFRVLCIISLFCVFWAKGSRGLQGLQHVWRGGILSLCHNSSILVVLMFSFDCSRCVAAFVWTLVSSAERLSMHNAGFIFYIILSELFHLSCTFLAWRNQRNAAIYEEPWHAVYSVRTKCACIAGQTISFILMAICYNIHRQTCWNGSYSVTSIFEWGFALYNLLFDATLWFDLRHEGWGFGELTSFRSALRAPQQKGTPFENLSSPRLLDDSDLKHFGNLDEREPGVDHIEVMSSSSSNFSDPQVRIITIVSPPSDSLMWVCDTFWGYQYFGSLVHSFQHVYFQPMVEMEFTKEVLAVFALFSPTLLMIPFLRRILTGGIPGTHRFVSWSKASTPTVPMYVLFYFIVTLSHLQQVVTKNSNLKILASGVAPFFLSLALFVRFLYPAAIRPEIEEVQECRRLCYTLPLGLVFSMIFRILYISQDPLYINPFYGCVFGIAGGLFFTLTIYRHALFHSQHRGMALNDPASVSNVLPDYQRNSFQTLVKSYRSISAFWLGVLYGALLSFGLLFLISPYIIPRYLAIDPFPASIWVVLVFFVGLLCSPSLLPINSSSEETVGRGIFPERFMRIHKAVPVLFSAFFLLFTILMLFSTRQSNFTYSSQRYHYHEPNVSIKDWKVQDTFSGSKHFAFLCGLGMVFCAGVLFPVAMEITWVQRRYRCSLFMKAEMGNIETRLRFNPFSFELTSNLVILFFIVSFVMCLCYPFVPLGQYFREGTRGFILILVSIITFALFVSLARTRRGALELHSSQNFSAQRRLPFGVVMLFLGTFICVLLGRFLLQPESRGFPNGDPGFAATYQPYILCMYDKLMDVRKVLNGLSDEEQSSASRAYIELTAENMMSSLRHSLPHEGCTAYRSRNLPPLSKEMNEKVLDVADALYQFSGLIWTIHFALDNYNADSLANMVTAIASTGASVVGILESDLSHIQNGNRDVADFLSYYLGFPYVDNGPVPLDNTFGCALISRYPILSVRRYILPSPLGELSCLIHATLDVMGVHVETYVGHFGNTQHDADGFLQSQFLGQLVRSNPGPSMWLGYLVTYPGNKQKYAEYTDPDKPGYFRDAGHTLYTKRPWVRLLERGGYDEIPPPRDRVIPKEEFTDFNVEAKIGVAAYLEEGLDHIDESFRDAPHGEKKRTFYFNETNRYTRYHPRWDFLSRYCEYCFYKTGKKKDELPDDWGKLQLYAVELYDWIRVADNAFIDSLSDTEIQLLQLRFVEQED